MADELQTRDGSAVKPLGYIDPAVIKWLTCADSGSMQIIVAIGQESAGKKYTTPIYLAAFPSEWRSIETAPKMKEVLVCSEWGRSIAVQEKDGTWYARRDGMIAAYETLDEALVHPTHWMPLPAAPAQEG